tara:strand:+ start:77 stop:253 length:177 start_codon:yes stop_codon:yes gene_type:complete
MAVIAGKPVTATFHTKSNDVSWTVPVGASRFGIDGDAKNLWAMSLGVHLLSGSHSVLL